MFLFQLSRPEGFNKNEALPLLSTGQMFKLLECKSVELNYSTESHPVICLNDGTQFSALVLVDALWLAVKYVIGS